MSKQNSVQLSSNFYHFSLIQQKPIIFGNNPLTWDENFVPSGRIITKENRFLLDYEKMVRGRA